MKPHAIRLCKSMADQDDLDVQLKYGFVSLVTAMDSDSQLSCEFFLSKS
jgi:hypothetical protein